MDFSTRPSNVRVYQFHHFGTEEYYYNNDFVFKTAGCQSADGFSGSFSILLLIFSTLFCKLCLVLVLGSLRGNPVEVRSGPAAVIPILPVGIRAFAGNLGAIGETSEVVFLMVTLLWLRHSI